MCGRFAVTVPSDAMAQLFAARPANDLPPVPNYNVCPTNPVHAITSNSQTRSLHSMRWGFVPHWYKALNDGPLLINARAETIARKSAFREAVRTRRCLIPATGFYEWTKDGEGARWPWYIAPPAGEILAFAGVWQDWAREGETVTSCTIVTTSANSTLKAIHHRMPVILRAKDWPLWLGEAGHGAAKLMTPAPEDALQVYRVDPSVNSSRASGPDLIRPVST